MPDFHEPVRQDVKKHPSYELAGIKRHYFGFIAIGIVPPAERYTAVFQLQNAMIADGNPIGVPAQVLKHALGAVKRRLAVDNPLLVVKLSSE